jgi:hypothetical protein
MPKWWNNGTAKPRSAPDSSVGVTDVICPYHCGGKEICYNSLSLSENRCGLDTKVTATLLRLGFRPFEVPVSYYSRPHPQGKKINWRDAFACLRILFQVRFMGKSKLTLSTAEQIEPKDLLFAPMLTQRDPDAEIAALGTFDSTEPLRRTWSQVMKGRRPLPPVVAAESISFGMTYPPAAAGKQVKR